MKYLLIITHVCQVNLWGIYQYLTRLGIAVGGAFRCQLYLIVSKAIGSADCFISQSHEQIIYLPVDIVISGK